MQTKDITDENITKLKALFPNVVTEAKDEEGNVREAIDFDVLRQELSHEIVEGREERYQFTWPDKKKAMLEANTPINKTLRPVVEDSVGKDGTPGGFDSENLYIEGDNLDVLKLLRETYLGKIKMIYIDPPYNTGNDFIYDDDFSMESDQWSEVSGQVSEEGFRMVQNTESNGRFHTDWLNMMYPRLKLAKDLLSEDGVIFISIDDHEVENLKRICDEIYSEKNFVAIFPWRKRTAKSDVPFGISQDYEHILCYAKSNIYIAGIDGKGRKYFETNDFPNRPWRYHDMSTQRTALERPNSNFDIIDPKRNIKYPVNPNAVWRITEKDFDNYYKSNRLIFPGDYDFLNISKPVLRYWKEDDIKKIGIENFGKVSVSTKLPDDIGMSETGTKEITEIFNNIKLFSYPKPSNLIKFIEKISLASRDTILDFFSGSATTAHAVMQLNAEDGGQRKFIMVQLPELTDEKSEAYKAGYKNICEIGKERIRRAGKKVVRDQLSGISDEIKAEYGCIEVSEALCYKKSRTLNFGDNDESKALPGFSCMAESDGSRQADLSHRQKTAKGRDLFDFRPDAQSSSLNSIQHSRGTCEKFDEGVSSLSEHSERIEGGTANTAHDLRSSRLLCRYGYFGTHKQTGRSGKNDSCPFKGTDNCPLTTDNSLDIGFRCLRIDSSNMNDVYYRPKDYTKDLIDMAENNIKSDRSPMDLLFQVMLDLGISLSSPIEKATIQGKEIFNVDSNILIACFDDKIDESVITAIAKQKPYYFVMRDSGMANDSVAANFEQIFETFSRDTVRRVL